MKALNNKSSKSAANFTLQGGKRVLLLMAFGAGLSGYTLFIIGIHALGLAHISRQFTLPYRAVFLSFAIILIIYGIIKKYFSSIGYLWIPLLVFWGIYLLRILLDGFLDPVPLRQPPVEYLQKAIGVTFIPMFMYLVRLDKRSNDWAFKAFWTVQISCLLISILIYNRYFQESYRFLIYYGVDVAWLLSPFTLSYVGVIASVISVQNMFKEEIYQRRMKLIILLSIFVFGTVLMFYGGTRSAPIALILTLLVIGYSNISEKRNIGHYIMVMVLLMILAGIAYAIMQRMGSALAGRYEVLSYDLKSDNPMAGGGRLQIYRDTIEQIKTNFLLGSSLEQQNTQFYPHNHVLEAFMATGVLGGMSFIVLVCISVSRLIYILKHKKQYGWIACYFLVFLIGGAFSSSIIEPNLWYSMLCVMSIRKENRRA